MALTTITDLEAHLATTFAGDDITLVTSTWLPQAQAAAEQFCLQPLEHASVTEVFEVDQWEQRYVTDRYPVTAVTSVTEDDTVLTVTDEYLFYQDGRLRRVNGSLDWSWSMFPNAVSVVYTAGYGTGAPSPFDAVPADLVLAIVSIATDLLNETRIFAEHAGVPVKQVQLEGSDAVTYGEPDRKPGELSKGVKLLLSPYMRRKL